MQQVTIEPDRPDAPFSVFEVTGHLDLDTQDGFEAEVSHLLQDGSVVVDLTRLEFLSISSLRALLSCERSATAGHHCVVYAGAPQQARRLLTVSGLDGVLRVSGTVGDAGELVRRG